MCCSGGSSVELAVLAAERDFVVAADSWFDDDATALPSRGGVLFMKNSEIWSKMKSSFVPLISPIPDEIQREIDWERRSVIPENPEPDNPANFEEIQAPLARVHLSQSSS